MTSIEQLAAQIYIHASDVVKGRFPEGESVILHNSYYAFCYANYVLRAPWPAAEAIIMTSSFNSYYYAKDVLKAPWPAAEAIINSNHDAAKLYKKFLATLEPNKPVFKEDMIKITIVNDKFYIIPMKTNMRGFIIGMVNDDNQKDYMSDYPFLEDVVQYM